LSVSTALAETFGFELFENYKQLISYAGYDVVENQSGKRSGKTKISKAMVAVQHEQTAFYNLYNRTFEKHGIPMKSLVAVQKKLLVTIFAMWKNNTAYDNDYISEAATVINEPVTV